MTNLQILTLPVGQMKANCYLLIDNQSLDSIIVDPGDDAEFIQNRIRDLGATPKMIIATHGHFDHTGAVLELKLSYKIPFLMNKKDYFLLLQNRQSAKHFTGNDIGPAPVVNKNITERLEIVLGENKFVVWETPGHTPGSICLYDETEKVILVGDLVFAEGGVGRTDFSYSSRIDLENSIKRITQLPKEIIVYPGHGDSFLLTNYT